LAIDRAVEPSKLQGTGCDSVRTMTARPVGWIRRRWLWLALATTFVLVLVGLVLMRSSQADWGTPAERVASPTGEYEVVQYEWSAMINPG
jgi:hypothetical protein